VPGNRARLLDPRRTPVAVTAVDAERGMFEVEVGAFEDAGARWWLPAEDAPRFQFARGSARADDAGLRAAVARFDRPLRIDAAPAAGARTRARIAATRPGALDELRDLDDAFFRTWASNPRSGELVKGHAIVLAELGLAPFAGTVVRDPALFAGAWSKERRAAHIVARLAWTAANVGPLTVFRGGPLPAGRPGSFVSATLDVRVAASHYGAYADAFIRRERVGPGRVFATHRETPALNHPYRESEVVLLSGSGARGG
jgi:hypothetical protein